MTIHTSSTVVTLTNPTGHYSDFPGGAALLSLPHQKGLCMKIFITGGSGYLGRALLRVLTEKQPNTECTIFSRDHGKHSRCQKEFPQHRYIIGDVRDYNSVELAMAGHDVVVHAAAFKYVPEGETNVVECHEINTLGSLNVARAALRTMVKRVVGLSTDKACQPINVYGMTKLMMERIFQEFDKKGETRYNLVRYGNVVSSTGSAIPIFRRQAKEDKVVRITNPHMTRFWLTVYEAVDLILKAMDEPTGATILIPRLPSIMMSDVAKAAATIELGSVDGVKFETMGIRFGEKLHEDLLGTIEAPYSETVNENLIRLYPLTSKDNGRKGCRYYSGEPYRYFSIQEITKMIQEAPE